MYFYAVVILCILFGCFCSLTFETANILAFLFFISFIFTVKLFLFRKKNILNIMTMALIVAFSLGVGTGTFHYWRTFKDAVPLYGTSVYIEGVVTSNGKNFFEIKTEKQSYTIYNFTENVPELNDYVKVKGILQSHSVSPYPGAFNSKYYNAIKGNVGHITCDNVEILGKESKLDLGFTVRNYIKQKVFSFNSSDEVNGFIIAVLTGDKSFLTEDTVDNFSLCGISHIIAISGLHIGIFLSLFLGIFKFFGKRKITNFVFSLILVLGYVLVVGGRASVIRAGIMSVLSVTFLCMRKRSDSIINLCIAGLIICISNPFYAVDSGFILSFVATFIIVFYADFMKIKWISIPLIVWLLMLPLSIFYCNVFSMETVVVNIIVVPLMPFLILFGYIGCVVPLVLHLACGVARIIIYVAGYFASIDWLHLYLPSTRPYQFVVWAILMLAIYMILRKKSLIFISSILVVAVSVYVNGAFVSSFDDVNKISVNFINCGNSNMKHIKTDGGNNVLIDCPDDAYEYALKSGINEFYSVIITKNIPSRVKGLEKLCKSYDVKYVFVPEGMDVQNLNLEKTKVLYYNYSSYNFKTDGVEFNFTKRNNTRCLLVKTFDDVIAIPVDKKIQNIGKYTVLCVPDSCESIGDFLSEYYIYPTEKNANVEFGNKYVTSVDGMVRMIFEKDEDPLVGV